MHYLKINASREDYADLQAVPTSAVPICEADAHGWYLHYSVVLIKLLDPSKPAFVHASEKAIERFM